MKTEDKTGCLLAVIVFLLAIPSIIWRGYVLSILWGWFIVTKFGLPVLGIAEAIALALIASYLTKQHEDVQKSSKSGTEKLSEAIAAMILTPAFALLMGWILKHWVA